jgi:hypothetical protein
LLIDSARATALSQPLTEGGAELTLQLTISDQTPWADTLWVYAISPGLTCQPTHEAVSNLLLGNLSTAQQLLYQGVETEIASALGSYPFGEPHPVSATFSFQAGEVSPPFSTVCVLNSDTSTDPMPTVDMAQAAITFE